MASLLEEALEAVGPARLWVNPDCGLKTRDYPEVLASLRNMVAAARRVRATTARSRPPADDR
jgi:5-methyltetrahydropteroyltriglutamate--homocysteine methyltransferase